jgi:hypothetical protein
MIYNLLFGFYEKTTDFIKEKINNYFFTRPEKGLVEKNVFLFGEHLFFLLFGFGLFGQEDWLYDITMMWDSQLSFSVCLYYYLYITRYVVQTKQLQSSDKEYYTYLAHHISTITLLSLSFFRQSRIGITIGILHEYVDLVLLPAKICHRFYETRDLEILNTISYLLFLFFVPVYFYTRIYQNGYIVYYLRSSEIFTNFTNYSIKTFQEHPEEIICFYFLHINLIIQMIWQVMIIKFVYSISSGNPAIDEKDNSYFKKKK